MTSDQSKVRLDQLDIGYEFSPASYNLDAEIVSEYLEAVGEASSLYQQSGNPRALTGLIPPMAVATFAMTALSQRLSLSPGSIHITQELEFLKAIEVGDKITCHARVSRKWERGKFQLLTIDLSVLDLSLIHI